MAQTFLTSSRHGTIFYYRRRVPDDLRLIIKKPYLVKTLATSHRGTAIVLARAYATRTDAIYRNLRAMKKRDPEYLQTDFTFTIDLDDLGFTKKIHVDAQPEESEAVAIVLKAALQNRPNMADAAQINQSSKLQLITPMALFDNFFREGVGANRWKEPETARKHDYEPIWKKFSTHTDLHGLTLAAAKHYRAEVLASTLSQETKHRNLYRIYAIVTYGVAHHELDARMLPELKMPQIKGRGKNSRAKSYLPFTSEELLMLFHSEAYRQNSFKKPSHYWLPMLGLYTGARLEELAGLHLSAFTTVEEIAAITLSDEDTTDGGKNGYAPRQVPMHQELIKAGLLQYVAMLRTVGHGRLFPEIKAAERDGFGKRATTDFTEYRRTVGVGKDKGERSRQVFHSFRTTLCVKFFHHGIDGDLSRRLTGHAAIDVHQGTYLGAAAIPMKRAAAAMNEISFGLVHPEFTDSASYVKARNRAQQGQAVLIGRGETGVGESIFIK